MSPSLAASTVRRVLLGQDSTAGVSVLPEDIRITAAVGGLPRVTQLCRECLSSGP